MKDNQKAIPEQRSGAHTDTIAEIRLDSKTQALEHFEVVKDRLLNVSGWQELAGKVSADFQLIDPEGNKVDRGAREGDYFRIDIPAPGTEAGEGHDWVQIEKIQHYGDRDSNSECLSIRVRPSAGPGSAKGEAAHFFKEKATSTFVVERTGLIIRAEVHGRNEEPNTDSEGVLDTVRNFVVGIGAILGFSKVQWKTLVSALVKKE